MQQPHLFPSIEPTRKGQLVAIAPGVHWIRLPMPFRLDHINLWALDDGQGWTLVDTGLRTEETQSSSKPLCEDLHAWLKLERQRVPEGSATAKAIDYSLNRWAALTTYLADGNVQIDNNHLENLIRPWAMGRRAWLFAGSELAGQRAAIIMSLLQSAKLHGHDSWAYLKDVLTRLPGHMNVSVQQTRLE